MAADPEEQVLDETAADDPPEGMAVWRDLESLRAMMQPLRMRAFVEAAKGPVSAKELSERLEVPLQRMSYHVRLLHDAGLLRVVRKTPRRGAVETHYRAVATLDLDDEALLATPELLEVFLRMYLGVLTEDIEHAIMRGPEVCTEVFLARAHFNVDAAGVERIRQELRDFYDRLAELEKEHRVDDDDDAEPINISLVLHPGKRSSGRNGPTIFQVGNDQLTIPPD